MSKKVSSVVRVNVILDIELKPSDTYTHSVEKLEILEKTINACWSVESSKVDFKIYKSEEGPDIHAVNILEIHQERDPNSVGGVKEILARDENALILKRWRDTLVNNIEE